MPVTAFAPGRVNLIGEHTDYAGGLSLPFATPQGVEVRARPLPDRIVEVRSLGLGESDAFGLDDIRPAAGWRAYVRGTAAELDASERLPRGARLEIESDLPMRAGLGSSAALCLAVRLALGTVAGATAPEGPWEVARALARVERSWAGAATGLLDQLASLLGRPGHAVLLDFEAETHEHVPLALGDLRLAVVGSAGPRSNAESGFNRRRAEWEAARSALGITSLEQVTPEALARLGAPLRGRAEHVLGETARVREAVRALRAGGPAALGPLLDASHASLRDLLEVSVPEVEAARERARAAGAAGSRLHGGGFGGGVLALFPAGAEPPAGSLAVAPSGGACLR